MRVAIIGGGLAGTACAYVLRRAGLTPEIYEAAPKLAAAASGNPVGLYNPRFSMHRTPESDYYAAAFSLAVRTFERLSNIDHNPCGALHLITDEKRRQRFPQTLKNWGWDSDHMRLLSAEKASEIAGIELTRDALYLPDAGCVSPHRLCHAYAEGVRTYPGRIVKNIRDVEADVIILACGTAIKNFEEADWLPVYPVRGQITMVKASSLSAQLQCNLCYGGYISPAQDGLHMLGATFQRWLDHREPRQADNQDNLDKLRERYPALAEELEIAGHRAALRTASKDHFPIVGALPGYQNLYVSAAHGSHGILSTLMAAHLLTDMVLKRQKCLPDATVQKLDPARFLP